jgi:hypothetical protein
MFHNFFLVLKRSDLFHLTWLWKSSCFPNTTGGYVWCLKNVFTNLDTKQRVCTWADACNSICVNAAIISKCVQCHSCLPMHMPRTCWHDVARYQTCTMACSDVEAHLHMITNVACCMQLTRTGIRRETIFLGVQESRKMQMQIGPGKTRISCGRA